MSEAVAYAIEIGRALECAHANLLVHRDVKPQNVLIDPDGRAKVTDFGIARSLEAQGLTATGRVLGTTDYVSPEQALGHEVTGQSDIYSLGIVLYEMLTGETPFKADTQVAVAMKHVREPLPDVQRRAPGDLRLAGARGRARDREGDAEPLPGRRTRWCTTSRRCSPSRRPAPGRPPARRPPCCSRCPATPPTSPRSACAGPGACSRSPCSCSRRWPRRAVFLATRTEKGPGGPVVKKPRGLTEVRLAGNAASDYDPEGDNSESPEATRLAIDGIRSTNWDTESYQGGFAGSHKSGVGLYVDAGKVIARPRPRARDRHTRFQGGGLRLRDRAAEPGGLDPAHAGEAGQGGLHLPLRHARPQVPQLSALDQRAASRQARRPRSRSCRSSSSGADQGDGGAGESVSSCFRTPTTITTWLPLST